MTSQLASDDRSSSRVRDLKYGENAEQAAALYTRGGSWPLAISRFQKVQGDPEGLINLVDLKRAREILIQIVRGFVANGLSIPEIAVIVKHGNPVCAGIAWDSED